MFIIILIEIKTILIFILTLNSLIILTQFKMQYFNNTSFSKKQIKLKRVNKKTKCETHLRLSLTRRTCRSTCRVFPSTCSPMSGSRSAPTWAVWARLRSFSPRSKSSRPFRVRRWRVDWRSRPFRSRRARWYRAAEMRKCFFLF